MVPTVEWKDGAVRILDQSRLPEQVEFLDCKDYQTVAPGTAGTRGASYRRDGRDGRRPRRAVVDNDLVRRVRQGGDGHL